MKRFKALFLLFLAALCGCSADMPVQQQPQIIPATAVTEAAAETTPVTDYSQLMQCLYYNEDMFHIYNSCAGEYKTENPVMCGVAPHHLTAGHMIAGLYKTASETRGEIDTVVIVAPLHYTEKGETCTASVGWATPFGALENDNGLSQLFTDRLGAVKNDDLIEYDHAISSHIPFIKYYFPGASAACLLVSPSVSGDFPEKLSQTLFDMSEMKNCLFIFSIDFSHYLSPEEAEKNDAETLDAVMAADTESIERMRNDNVDTPVGLSTYVRLSGMLGGEISCADNSHTQKINGSPYNEIDYPEGVTSYFVFITE